MEGKGGGHFIGEPSVLSHQLALQKVVLVSVPGAFTVRQYQ
jgi:hypothetical protein